VKSDKEYLHSVIDSAIRETRNDDEAADLVYQRTAKRVIERFRPLYEQSGGKCGFVTIQSDPRWDEDAKSVIRAMKSYRALGPNFMTKIPVTAPGIQAIEAAVEANVPICATEVFALSQAIAICESYEKAAKRTGKRPPFYVTHISGIFDEYLEKVAKREGIKVSPEALKQAGCAIARKQYRLLKKRGYQTKLLGGGARGIHHFTELVGGEIEITINWSTAEELIGANTPVVSRIEAETPQPVIDELCEKFTAFRQAWFEDGLKVAEFEHYGPVQLFRNAFLNGYYVLLAEVVSRRHALAL
jgi:transaldolase